MVIELNNFIPWLTSYGYAVLFPLSVIEGPIVTVLSGFLVSQGYFNMLLVYSVMVIGDLVGDTFYYCLGRLGRTQFANTWGKYIGITTERIQSLEKHFEQHAGKTLILGKLAHGVGAAALVAAGAAHVPYGKFLWFNLISTLPKSLMLILIGYYLGETYAHISRYLDYTSWGTLILAGIAIALYWGIRTGAKKISTKEQL